MLKIDYKLVRTMFFDRAKIKKKVDARTRKVLSKFGAFVRQTSRKSIRKRKGASKPGRPPFSHTGVLKRFLFFGYDSDRRSVVIGPVIAPGKRDGSRERRHGRGGEQLRADAGRLGRIDELLTFRNKIESD